MLRKINLSATNGTLIAGVLFIISFNILFAFYQAPGNGYDSEILTGDMPGSQSEIPYDTLLTYEAFQQLQNDRQALQKWTNRVDNGQLTSGWSVNTSFANCKTITECDTCTSLASFRKSEGTVKRYIALPGYVFRERDTRFFMQRGQYRLSVPHWDKEDRYRDGGKGRSGHYEDKAVAFRYAVNQQSPRREEPGEVLIPLAEGRYRFLSVLLFVLFLPLAFWAVYVFLSLPFRLYLNISRGEAFNHGNIRKLQWIAWTLLLSPFVVIFIRLLFRLMYNDYFTADVQLDITGFLYHNQLALIIGLLVLAVVRAFQKGLSLQEEQDLTI